MESCETHKECRDTDLFLGAFLCQVKISMLYL
jgi:hypothetical protein